MLIPQKPAHFVVNQQGNVGPLIPDAKNPGDFVDTLARPSSRESLPVVASEVWLGV